MKLLRSITAFRHGARRVAFAAGFFDGVHTGHQRVIGAAQTAAAEAGGEAWALTFEPHPSHILSPAAPRKLLTPLGERLELLAETGLHGCLLLAFDATLAALPPEDFVAALTSRHGPVVSFHSGGNWRFGRAGTGTPDFLRSLAPDYGFRVDVQPPVLWQDLPVSSTRIRAAILTGDLDAAAAMLGRLYRVRERTVPGRAIGRTLGAPTLNIQPASDVLPPPGVYAVRVRLGDETVWRGAVANFGFRPTFSDRPGAPVLEAHLFEPPPHGTCGGDIEIAFAARLRDERAFPSPAALAGQIQEDRLQAETILDACRMPVQIIT